MDFREFLGNFLSLVYSCDMYSFLACQSVGAAGLAAGTQAGIFCAASIGGLAAGLFEKIRKMMINLMIKLMTPFMTENRFLEAPRRRKRIVQEQ